jgi:tripartite-type tricarboxylate transporter receptor subunit TctC
MHCLVLAISLAVGASALPGDCRSQSYPAKALRMIVPFPPGGAADVIGRVLAERLSDRLRQPVIVENRSGASGNLGAEAVAKAPSDGHTLLLAALTSHTINYTLERATLGYDLIRDFVPVSIVATVPAVFVVHPTVPARTLREFLDYARMRPGQITYGSSGSGAPQRLGVELLKLRTGIEMLHVPYRGSGQVIVDLIGGRVLAAFEALPAALPHIRANRLRALAVATTERDQLLPDVPTVQEAASLTDFEIESTFGVLVPAGTRRAVIDRLSDEVAQVAAEIEFRERLARQGIRARHIGPQLAADRIRAEIALWAKVIAAANIKIE